MPRRVPVRDGRVERAGHGKQRILEHTRVARLVEGYDIDVVSLVLLDDVLGVVVGVEGIHEHKGHVDIVGPVEVLNLSYRQIEEGHAIADLDDGLGADASHGCAQTTVELEHGELAEKLDRLGVAQGVVVDHLRRIRRGDMIPVAERSYRPSATTFVHVDAGRVCVALTAWHPWPCRSDSGGRGRRSCPFRSQTATVVSGFGGFGMRRSSNEDDQLPYLLLMGILDRIGQVVERVPHLAGSDRGRRILERLR